MDKNTDELKRLYERLYELDEEYEKNKKNRHIISMLLFVAAKMILLCADTNPQTADEFVYCLIVSVIWGLVSHWVCFYLFAHHFVKCQEENSLIKYIKEEIAKLEKANKRDNNL